MMPLQLAHSEGCYRCPFLVSHHTNAAEVGSTMKAVRRMLGRAEELLEVVDRTAANAAIVRERAGSISDIAGSVEAQLAALEPNIRKTTPVKLPPTIAATPQERGPGCASPSSERPPHVRSAAIAAAVGCAVSDTAGGRGVQVTPTSSENGDTGNGVTEVHVRTYGSEAEAESGAESEDRNGGSATEAGIGSPGREAVPISGDEPTEAEMKSETESNGKEESVAVQLAEEEVDSGSDTLQESGAGTGTGTRVGVGIGVGKEEDVKSNPKPVAVQQELKEAQGLLKSATSVGQSKEARLARICARLSSRLQEYKGENAQLEELLTAEREVRGSVDSAVRLLQHALGAAQAETKAAEEKWASAIAAKNSELEQMASLVLETKRQSAVTEGKLASLQSNTDMFTKTRDVSEARMIQALREELASAERRVEEERGAHVATRQALTQREIELEQRVAESVGALTRMQRAVDERTQKAGDLEDKVAMLEVECATLNQEVQAVEARQRREQKRPGDDAQGAAQLGAWREEAERARHLQQAAEARLTAAEAESQKLRVEVEARKREKESGEGGAQAELEKRFRELTELLYLKQTQLESMSSEKQAALLRLEKETRRFREAKAAVEREKVIRRNVMEVDDNDQELRSLESLGLQERRIAPSIQRAARIIDRGTVSAGRFLWRRPMARLVLLGYLVFVHLFLMYLLHRLQEQAEMFMSNDRAYQAAEAASGLVKPSHTVRKLHGP